MKKALLHRLRRTAIPLTCGFFLTVLACLAYIHEPLLVRHLNGKVHDLFLQKHHATTTTGMVTIVDIDEKSLARQGQWPWPRYRMALLLERLRALKPAVVACDIIFAEPDRTSLATVHASLLQDLRFSLPLTNIPPALLDNDALFANSIRKTPTVLSFFLRNDHSENRSPGDTISTFPITIVQKPGARKPVDCVLQADTMTAPLMPFSRAARYSGFTNTIPDADGILRRTPLVMSLHKRLYPSLALAAVRVAMHNPQVVLKMTTGGVESMRIGPRVVPLDRNGRITIHYRGGQKTFPFLSATDVLEGAVAKEHVTGKVVFIGSSAAGLKDIRTTPLDAVYPGVEAQATVADNILAGDFVKRPDWAPGLELSLVIMSGIVTTLLISLASARWTLPVTASSMALFWFGADWLFQHDRYTVSPIMPMATAGLVFAVVTVVKFWLEEQDKRFLRSAFSRYVPDSVVQEITADPHALSLAGEERFMTILFSDIRGFTSMSESLAPSEVTEILRLYFTPMTRTILNHQGTIDKFIGDALMAFWNAPVAVEGHQGLAIQAALAMIQELAKLNPAIKEKFGITLKSGIGLHAGTVRVGNMGSDDLFDYTVIGDEVNLASRLEGLSKFYGVSLVVSDAMKPFCPEAVLIQELDTVLVKGKDKPVTIFTLHDPELSDVTTDELELHHNALQLYKERNFDQAGRKFIGLTEQFPHRILYRIYSDRCAAYHQTPPPDDWDGSYRHLAK